MKKTKGYILLSEIVIFLVMFALVLADKNYDSFCNGWNNNYGTTHYCVNIFWIIAPIFFAFPFSLITYFLREEIFRSWIRFTYIWVPVSMFLVLIIPGGAGNGAFPSLIDKESVSILMSGLYFIISLIMIIFGIVKYYWFKK